MSGIAGIIHFDGRPAERARIKQMTGAMAHRGPDGINHWVQGSVALGQCMMRTTPESLEETQPLANEDESVVLVMDGRIDNWVELRKELNKVGLEVRSRSDAELVLRAYEIWGRQAFLDRIDGDFAIVIWDGRRQEVVCARDRIGNKPLTYFWNGKVFIFASELSAILTQPEVPQVQNEGMLAEFLAGEWISLTETLWKDIMRLEAAHRITIRAEAQQLERYWQPDTRETLSYKRDEDYLEHYRELLFDCVRRLSRSHRTISCEVSGGLNSSAVFAVAHHLSRSGELRAPRVAGFTLAFPPGGDADEIAYARAVAKFLDVEIVEVPPSGWPLSWFKEKARVERDFPGFPNGAMLQGIRQEIASSSSRVVLTGEGGDEWLRGSRLYYADALRQLELPTLLKSLRCDSGLFGLSQTMKWLLRDGVLPLLPRTLNGGLKNAVRRVRGPQSPEYYWLAPHMQKLARERRENRTYTAVGLPSQRTLSANLADAHSAIVMETAERLSARNGIEQRYPMRTAPFVQFAFSTPEHLRLRGDEPKHIHVKSMRGYLPDEVLLRRGKAEFSVIFRDHLIQMAQHLSERLPARRSEWLDPEGMAELYQSYQQRGGQGWQTWILWSIVATDLLVTKRDI